MLALMPLQISPAIHPAGEHPELVQNACCWRRPLNFVSLPRPSSIGARHHDRVAAILALFVIGSAFFAGALTRFR